MVLDTFDINIVDIFIRNGMTIRHIPDHMFYLNRNCHDINYLFDLVSRGAKYDTSCNRKSLFINIILGNPGRDDLVDLLLSYGAPVNQKGVNLLYIPISRGDWNIVDLLLRNGCDSNYAPSFICPCFDPLRYDRSQTYNNIHQKNALYHTIISGNAPIVDTLIANGCNINGNNMIDNAITQILVDKGCPFNTNVIDKILQFNDQMITPNIPQDVIMKALYSTISNHYQRDDYLMFFINYALVTPSMLNKQTTFNVNDDFFRITTTMATTFIWNDRYSRITTTIMTLIQNHPHISQDVKNAYNRIIDFFNIDACT